MLRAILPFLLIVPSKADARPLILWHTQDKSQAKLLEEIVKEWGKKQKVQVKVETGVVLEETLITELDKGKAPDVVFAPSNLTSLFRKVKLSEVPANIAGSTIDRKWIDTVTVHGKVYGVPVIAGNHLMLFYNRSLVRTPAATWKELEAQKAVIAVNYLNAFTFLTVLTSFNGWPMANGKLNLDTDEMVAALKFYKSILDRGLVKKTCDYTCTTDRFYDGNYKYAISGDWAFDSASAAMGKNFGVALLPAVAGRAMRTVSATHALFFPGRSLTGKRGAHLRSLTRWFLSSKIQRRWFDRGQRFPVRTDTLKDIKARLPDNLRTSLTQLVQARPMPSDPEIAYIWPAINKGMQLYLMGVKSAREAADYMQYLATKRR